jgi:hypothetical protein
MGGTLSYIGGGYFRGGVKKGSKVGFLRVLKGFGSFLGSFWIILRGILKVLGSFWIILTLTFTQNYHFEFMWFSFIY